MSDLFICFFNGEIIFGAFLSLIEFLSKFKSCVKPGKAKIRISALPYNSLQRRQLSISPWKRLETKVAGDNKSEREAQIFALLKQSHRQSAIDCVKKNAASEILCWCWRVFSIKESRELSSHVRFMSTLSEQQTSSVFCVCVLAERP